MSSVATQLLSIRLSFSSRPSDAKWLKNFVADAGQECLAKLLDTECAQGLADIFHICRILDVVSI